MLALLFLAMGTVSAFAWDTGEDPKEPAAAIVKEFLGLALKGERKALKMLVIEDFRKLKDSYAQDLPRRWNPPAGFVSQEYGEVLGDFIQGRRCLVILRRRLVADPATAQREKVHYEQLIGELFPSEQRVPAKKMIYWQGNALESVEPMFLSLEGFHWQVYMNLPDDFPLPPIRELLMKKWGFNPVRWNHVDNTLPGPLPYSAVFEGEGPEGAGGPGSK